MKRIWILIALAFLAACAGNRNDQFRGDELIREMKLVVKMEPENPMSYIQLGNAYFQNSLYDEAMHAYDQALKLRPGLNEALVQKGRTFWVTGDTVNAVKTFKSVLYSPSAESYSGRIAEIVGCPFEITRVTDNRGSNAFPSCSPVDDKILFQSNRDGNWEIYLMRSDGDVIKRLTVNKARDENPVFAPDGHTFAFTSTRDDTKHVRLEEVVREIYLGHTEGTKETRLTRNETDDWSPVFSPDGSRLLFLSDRMQTDQDGGVNIFQMALADGETKQLTNSGSIKYLGGYTPNGNEIYYADNRDGMFKVYQRRLSGGPAKLLLEYKGGCTGPRLSPDQKSLVFFANVNNNFDVYWASLDSMHVKKLTLDPAIDANPVFSADGQKIYFHSNRDGVYQIYRIDLQKKIKPQQLVERMNALLKHVK